MLDSLTSSNANFFFIKVSWVQALAHVAQAYNKVHKTHVYLQKKKLNNGHCSNASITRHKHWNDIS